MGRYKIKKAALGAQVVTIAQWHKEFAHLDELIRPVVLRVNDNNRLVTIRPKTASEIAEIRKLRGLPPDEGVMETRDGSLIAGAPILKLEET